MKRKQKKLGKKTVVMSALLMAISCGRGQFDEETSVQIPNFNFDLPTSIQGSGLRLSGDQTVLERWATRAENLSDRIDSVLTRLSQDEVGEAFSGKGPDGQLSGRITALSESVYGRQAVLCHSGVPFMLVKWSDDHQQIYAMRDFNISPFGGLSTAMIAELSYVGSGSDRNFVLQTDGQPFYDPIDVTDGEYRTLSISAILAGDGTFEASGVDDWHAASEVETFEGDSYLIGRIAADGSGEHVAYRKFHSECSDSFSESTRSPFCLGRAAGADSHFSEEEIQEAADRLSDIAIQSKSQLKSLALPKDLSCAE